MELKHIFLTQGYFIQIKFKAHQLRHLVLKIASEVILGWVLGVPKNIF